MYNKNVEVIFVMGVSGVGKSTIGKLLSETMSLPFYDGDDFHPIENVAKMSRGEALNDEDRKGWLQSLNLLAIEAVKKNGCVIVCSALKESYREILKKDVENQVQWVFLHGSFEQIKNRINNREGHYMGSELLQSQFDILEEPKNAIVVDISDSPENIVAYVTKKLNQS